MTTYHGDLIMDGTPKVDLFTGRDYLCVREFYDLSYFSIIEQSAQWVSS